MERYPAVAGQFYPEQKRALNHILDQYLAATAERIDALGVMVPHAGYVYSGAIAGQTFSKINIPSTVVILGPNHHGVGHPAALFGRGIWHTPLGTITIAEELGESLLHQCDMVRVDEHAHRYEHSLEVQVPFIQQLNPDASILPICLGHEPLDVLLNIGGALGKVIQESSQSVLIVASSDMSHYVPGPVAKEKDFQALDRVLALDPNGLFQTVRSGRISMCGVLPVVVMLAATKVLGATQATLVQYGNSGDVNGDQSSVVGYAGVVIV